jgi:hypothetical protein
MFLKTVRAKGNTYLYLCSYDPVKEVKVVYGFGRQDRAIQNMKKWLKNFNTFPPELINIGCSRQDLIKWIKKVEKKKSLSRKLAKFVSFLLQVLPTIFIIKTERINEKSSLILSNRLKFLVRRLYFIVVNSIIGYIYPSCKKRILPFYVNVSSRRVFLCGN